MIPEPDDYCMSLDLQAEFTQANYEPFKNLLARALIRRAHHAETELAKLRERVRELEEQFGLATLGTRKETT